MWDDAALYLRRVTGHPGRLPTATPNAFSTLASLRSMPAFTSALVDAFAIVAAEGKIFLLPTHATTAVLLFRWRRLPGRVSRQTCQSTIHSPEIGTWVCRKPTSNRFLS